MGFDHVRLCRLPAQARRTPDPSWGSITTGDPYYLDGLQMLLTPHGVRSRGYATVTPAYSQSPDPSWGSITRKRRRNRTGALTSEPMHRIDVYRMIRRRAAEAGFNQKLGCHVFRATGITAYLEAGGTLENAQAMAAHESPRTTKLYDRTGDEITLDEVERIQI
jgi:integrase